MTCPHCGVAVTDGARFCGGCGQTISSTAQSSHAGQPSTSTAEAPALIGREIAGRYRIREKLGEGGMGAVYKAEQISLKRTVAVKLLRPEVASSQPLLRRFNAEAEAVAKLSHPNTVNIYDFGQDSDGTLFIAMELVEGSSLRHVIHTEAPLPLRRALHIASQIAASITDAHAASIVHRDLKPDNVMLQARGKQRDTVRVLDFGIAKLRDEGRQTQMAMTQAGDMLGTPQYMAPEQIRAEHIDGRTDVYALGCILYEMITGRLPFEAPTVMALLSKHLLEPVIAPSQRRPDLALPPAIDQLVLGAMAKDPGARIATMEQLGEMIARLLATLPADSAPVPVASAVRAELASPPSFAPATPPSFAPATPPPPGSAAFVPAAPSAAYAPPPFVPTPSGYVPQGAGAPPYDPHANRVPVVHAPPGKKTSSAALWIALGVLVLGGTAVGIYAGTSKSSTATESRDASEPAEDEASPEEPTPDDPDPGSGADPWSGGSPSGGAALPAGATRTSVQGIAVDLPAGFSVVQSTPVLWVAANQARGVAFTVFALDPGSDDIGELARQYATQNKLTIIADEDTMIAGKTRKLVAFSGAVNGHDTIQGGTALIGPGYRVGVIFAVSQTALEADPSLGDLGDDLFQHRLFTP